MAAHDERLQRMTPITNALGTYYSDLQKLEAWNVIPRDCLESRRVETLAQLYTIRQNWSREFRAGGQDFIVNYIEYEKEFRRLSQHVLNFDAVLDLIKDLHRNPEAVMWAYMTPYPDPQYPPTADEVMFAEWLEACGDKY